MPAESLLAFLVASSLLSVAPGPDNLFVLMQSALYGRASGIMVTLGLCTGLIVHTLAVALGVAAIISASPFAFTLLKLAGACYLLYLAALAFKAMPAALTEDDDNQLSKRALYLRGIIMNITNPKVTVFFLAFLPQFTVPEAGHMTQQVLLLGAVFILIAFVIFSMIALLAGTLGIWLQRTPKAQLILNRIAGVVFCGIALSLVGAGV